MAASDSGPLDVSRVLTVDQSLVDDPYPVWAALRSSCPVYREPNFDVVVVTLALPVEQAARRIADATRAVLARAGLADR